MELLERIVSNRNMCRAYEQVMRNEGCGGVDGIEIGDVCVFVKSKPAGARVLASISKYVERR